MFVVMLSYTVLTKFQARKTYVSKLLLFYFPMSVLSADSCEKSNDLLFHRFMNFLYWNFRGNLINLEMQILEMHTLPSYFHNM